MPIQTSLNMLEPILGPDVKYILQEMEEIFPPVNPTPDTTVSQIMYRAGQRSVIEWLQQRINED